MATTTFPAWGGKVTKGAFLLFLAKIWKWWNWLFLVKVGYYIYTATKSKSTNKLTVANHGFKTGD